MLRYLRPSADFREMFQYNNLMFETLSYLPEVPLNQTYETYIREHIFKPLSMTASTFSVVEAAHVVKDYTNKAKTDMFLSLSER